MDALELAVDAVAAAGAGANAGTDGAALPAGRQPCFAAVSSRYRAYCFAREGKMSDRSVNGSSFVSLVKNDAIETFSPRRAV